MKKFQSTSPYAGDDESVRRGFCYVCDFNPRPPTRGTTVISAFLYVCAPNFNPRPPTRGTTCCFENTTFFRTISIHVPLRGGRLMICPTLFCLSIFQSTSPYAGDDNGHPRCAGNNKHFNPRPPTRGTTISSFHCWQSPPISIHVPLRGGRRRKYRHQHRRRLFQSTSPYAGDDAISVFLW